MADKPSSSAAAGLHEIVVTLPRAAIVALALLLALSVAASLWLALHAGSDGVRDLAKSVLLVLLPISVVLAAAVGIRRTSTTQVDELVTAFLDRTVATRLQLACEHRGTHGFPFAGATLTKPALGRSVAEYRLDWAGHAHAPADVWVKMNVVNFEVGTELSLRWPEALPKSDFLGPANLDEVLGHPVLQHLASTVQGSIEEGYKVRALFKPQGPGRIGLRLSVRQKLGEHFLASPFLKRYYAEDMVILVGVLFHELDEAGLLPPPGEGEEG
ncbi:MAG: hypothetical protein U1F53_19075 [Burkholderiaceae bacterium]